LITASLPQIPAPQAELLALALSRAELELGDDVVSLCDYFRVDNGALVEHWGVMDAAGMMQQLTAP
jgi:predicted SnoaL-like aldol condensation-catalyzing enzyme